MPVFTRVKGDVVVLTADGDYTAGELARVGDRALAGRAEPVPLLLDLSGAAGLGRLRAEELAAAGRAVGTLAHRLRRLAVVVGAAHAGHFGEESEFARAAAVRTRVFPRHADAIAWLDEATATTT